MASVETQRRQLKEDEEHIEDHEERIIETS
ncbi:uncharacterized protein G2W53_030321 [Senna tora]|uniref:Uncharacterized protein n=1 Tax=Senna tora TaxID=362788 RepID=A0A834WBH8_9FABA|nr:uncharacterized protein G2W53_030321 [Senna tora]